MGIEGQAEDNLETDIGLFADGVLIDTQVEQRRQHFVYTRRT